MSYKEYIAAAGDTFDLIALAAYSEERMASTIMQANPDYGDVLIFMGGECLIIPVVDQVQSTESLPPWRR